MISDIVCGFEPCLLYLLLLVWTVLCASARVYSVELPLFSSLTDRFLSTIAFRYGDGIALPRSNDPSPPFEFARSPPQQQLGTNPEISTAASSWIS